MKVLMVSDCIIGSGIGSVVYRLYNSLIENNVECDVVCYQDLSRNPEIREVFNKNGSRLIIIPRVTKGVFSYINNIRKICREGNYDAVHIHTSLLIFLAAFAARKEHVPVIIGHAHGAKFLNYPELVLKVLEPIGRRLNNRYCTNFVTCSQVSANYSFGHDAIFIPNYVPTNEILGVNENIVAKLRTQYCKANSVVFGYMGSLDGVKNAEFLPEVANSLKEQGLDVLFIIIGEGDSYNSINKRIKELKCDDAVVLLGRKSNCNEFVQIFDYYISASKSEGMSLSMIEAQMSGKPCFVSELIPDDSDLKVSLFYKLRSFNAKEWANQILNLIANDVKPISREEAYKRIKANHLTESDVINNLIKIYKRDDD